MEQGQSGRLQPRSAAWPRERPVPTAGCHPLPSTPPQPSGTPKAAAPLPLKRAANPYPGVCHSPTGSTEHLPVSPPPAARVPSPGSYLQLLVRVLLRVLAALALLAKFLQLCLALVEGVPLAPLLRLVFLQRSLDATGESSEPWPQLLPPRGDRNKQSPGKSGIPKAQRANRGQCCPVRGDVCDSGDPSVTRGRSCGRTQRPRAGSR